MSIKKVVKPILKQMGFIIDKEGKAKGLKPNFFAGYIKKVLAEYFNVLQRFLYEPVQFNEHRHLINMKNGMFDTKELKLKSHDKGYFNTIQIPVQYDKDAKCLLFIKYLECETNQEDRKRR